jgi:hypothetical protein
MTKTTTPKTHQPKPGDVAIEKDGSFYFPAWGIHVAKTAPAIKKTYKRFNKDGRHKVRVTEREVRVKIAGTVDEAKAHIKENHGIDVDNDTPPPQPPSED